MKEKKLCVYTCITGNYDNLKEIKKEKGIDYYCFTNNKNIKSNSWEVVYIEDKKLTNVQLARKIKILGHPIINDNYNFSFWIDGDIIVNKSINEFIKKFCNIDKYDFIALKHHCRNTIKEEMLACYQCKKETKEKIKNLQKFYKQNNFNDDFGLIESTIFIKNNNSKEVLRTMKLWFDMLLKYTHRDQLTFNYALSKTKLKIQWLNLNIWDNDWFIAEKHNDSKDINMFRIYYGKDYVNDFQFEDVEDREYLIEKSESIMEFYVLRDCTSIEIFPVNKIFTKISNINIIDGKFKISYNNFYVNKEEIISFSEISSFIIKGNFKRNDKIKISFDMNLISESEKMKILTDLLSCYNDTKNQLDYLNDMINKLNNSLSWKITKPLRKINEIIKHNTN